MTSSSVVGAVTVTVTRDAGDSRVEPYNMISGTFISCLHASAAAAYIKSFNPAWSPSAIESALMTTSFPMSMETDRDAEFTYGSGHINPLEAKFTGLVYDMGEFDYVAFLCGQGYNLENLRLISRDNSSCSTNSIVYDLNYPSFSVSGESGTSITAVFRMIVTNVGSPSSTYKAVVVAPLGRTIDVQPSTLAFTGSLVLDDGVYQVRSLIVAYSI